MFPKTSPRKQSGAVLLAFVLVMISATSFVLLKQFNMTKQRVADNAQNAQALQQAKEALIAWSMNHPTYPGALPMPDRNNDGNYDGDSDCFNGTVNNNLLLGKLPWRNVPSPCIDSNLLTGLQIIPEDSAVEILWYAVSKNLVYQSPDYPPISIETLDTISDWIKIYDKEGNVVSDRVAFVVISPGFALEGQNRSGNAPAASNYLDSVTINGTIYSNADAIAGVDLDFIIYPDSDTTLDPDDRFNDQLLFVTIDEFMQHIERRVINETSNILSRYQTTYGALPWLSPFDNPDNSPFRAQLDSSTTPKTGWQGHLAFHWLNDPSTITGVNPFSTDLKISWREISGVTPSVSNFYEFFGITTVSSACLTNIDDCDENGIFLQAEPNAEPLEFEDIDCVWSDKNSVNCDEGTITLPPVSYTPDPACPVGTLTRTYTIKYPAYTGTSASINDPSSTVPDPPNFRTRKVTLTNNIPAQTDAIQIEDQYVGYIYFLGTCFGPFNLGTVGTGNLSFNNNDGTIEIDNIKYDLDVDDGEIPEWFVRNNWHKYIYVAYSEAEDLPGDSNFANACTAGTDCLTIHIDVDDSGNPLLPSIEDVRALVMYSGIELPLLAQIRPSASLSDYFEGDPDLEPLLPSLRENANGDEIYVTNPPSSQFNDKLRFARTCDSDITKLCWSE